MKVTLKDIIYWIIIILLTSWLVYLIFFNKPKVPFTIQDLQSKEQIDSLNGVIEIKDSTIKGLQMAYLNLANWDSALEAQKNKILIQEVYDKQDSIINTLSIDSLEHKIASRFGKR